VPAAKEASPVKVGLAFQGRSAEAIARDAELAFASRFGRDAAWLAVAPGRVNLIGDHTDYNDGFVLPLAIDRHVAIAAAPAGASSPALRLYSAALDALVEVAASGGPSAGGAPWWSYVQGVLAGCRAHGIAPPPLDALVLSDVPLGGGLSSSAALEVASATLFEAATGRTLSGLEKARLCQKAEHEYAGVPCGLMDQLASVFGDDHGALLIDCRSTETRPVPLPEGVTILVCNTNVKHALGDGGYARRRAECDEAAHVLGVKSLRDVSAGSLDGARLGPLLERRVRHVVSENARTVEAARALERGDVPALGDLLYASHASLRDDYEVSCAELDAVVEAAGAFDRSVVPGARMTGGGFGGCALVLVRDDRAAEVARTLEQAFVQRTRGALDVFVARPARGARALPVQGAASAGTRAR
jgi:galactokinase